MLPMLTKFGTAATPRLRGGNALDQLNRIQRFNVLAKSQTSLYRPWLPGIASELARIVTTEECVDSVYVAAEQVQIGVEWSKLFSLLCRGP